MAGEERCEAQLEVVDKRQRNGEATCSTDLCYDTLDSRPKKPVGDQYAEFDKFRQSGSSSDSAGPPHHPRDPREALDSVVEAIGPHRPAHPRHLPRGNVRMPRRRLAKGPFGNPGLLLRRPQFGPVPRLPLPHPRREPVRRLHSFAAQFLQSRQTLTGAHCPSAIPRAGRHIQSRPVVLFPKRLRSRSTTSRRPHASIPPSG